MTIDVENSTDPLSKLIEETSLTEIFGADLLRKEGISFDGSENTYNANQNISGPNQQEAKDNLYFVT